MSEKGGGQGGGSEESFQARLSAARQRQGLEPKAPEPAEDAILAANAAAVRLGLRIGTEMVSALIVAVAIGFGLDWLLGTKPVFIAVFVLLGGAAGVLNAWRAVASRRK